MRTNFNTYIFIFIVAFYIYSDTDLAGSPKGGVALADKISCPIA